MAYSKPKALEHIFTSKYDAQHPQDEIPFTREEVRAAIIATGGTPPDNLNNFVKDLTRTGKSDPRCKTAREHGYFLREGTHSESMGIFFRPQDSSSAEIAVICPSDIEVEVIAVDWPPHITDLLRPDEGGVIAALEYGNVLEHFFAPEMQSVRKVQSPVKIQPHELDSFFLLVRDGKRIPIPCEVKSKGNDVITLNQIIGVTAATLQRLMESDMDTVIPLGVKLESNGDIFVVSFPRCAISDLLDLPSKITASSFTKLARYRLSPLPPKWLI
jgi:hypothetical protein